MSQKAYALGWIALYSSVCLPLFGQYRSDAEFMSAFDPAKRAPALRQTGVTTSPTQSQGVFTAPKPALSLEYAREAAGALLDDTLAYSYYWRLAQLRRIDQRFTAGANAGGSTSAATPAGPAETIGAMLEAGAVSQTVSQNVVTFTSNGEALWEFLTNQQVVDCTNNSNASNPACKSDAHNLALSASFDVSKGGTQTLTGTTPGSTTPQTFTLPESGKQFSAATVQYAILNPRSPASKQGRMRWLQWRDRILSSMTQNTPLVKYLYERLLLENPAGTRGGPDNHVLTIFETLPAVFSRTDLTNSVKQMAAADPEFVVRYPQLEMEVLRNSVFLAEDQSNGAELSLLYTYSQPADEPKLHTFKLAWAKCPAKKDVCDHNLGIGTFTLNFGLEMYNDLQQNARGGQGMFRDVQAVVDWTRNIDKPVPLMGKNTNFADLTFAGYFQYMPDTVQVILPAGTSGPDGIPTAGQMPLLEPKGFIGVAELKTTIKLGESGTNVPMGITWSNRTDLIKASEVRGHIGFTFDASSLFGKH